jgi:hypothetical protein
MGGTLCPSLLGASHVRSRLGRRVRGLFGIAIIALAVSGTASAATCVTHANPCQTLVIQAVGPLKVHVQVLSCIAASGLSWVVRVTNGSDAVRVPTESSPALVPGRDVRLPHSGRWWLDVRVSNADPNGRCVQGESKSDPVSVVGPTATPRPAPAPRATPRPTPKPAASPTGEPTSPSPSPSSSVTEGVLSAQAGSSPGPSGSGLAAAQPSPLLLPPEVDNTLPEADTGFGGVSPLFVLVFFVLGVAGVELAVFAIRREIRLRRKP